MGQKHIIRAQPAEQSTLAFQHRNSGISMVNAGESLSPSLNRLLSGSGAYDGSEIAEAETRIHIKLKQ